jgi:hypothetical protein
MVSGAPGEHHFGRKMRIAHIVTGVGVAEWQTRQP